MLKADGCLQGFYKALKITAIVKKAVKGEAEGKEPEVRDGEDNTKC